MGKMSRITAEGPGAMGILCNCEAAGKHTHTHATARHGEMDVAEALNARDYKGLGRAVGSMGWSVGLVAVVVVVCPASRIVFCDEAKKE